MNFSATGRSGECAKFSTDSLSWDYELCCLNSDWSETKRSKQKFMNFFSDRLNYEMDFFHSFGCYIMVGGGTEYASVRSSTGANVDCSKFVFPTLASQISPATTVNGYIKELVASKQVTGLSEDSIGTSLRIGATNVMANSPGVELQHIIMRGGWEFSGFCNVFEYMLQITTSVGVGGRALAGWPNPRAICYPPSMMIVITEENSQLIANFQSSLLPFDFVTRQLEKLGDVLLASIVQHLEAVATTYGTNHIIVATVMGVAKRLG